MPVISLEPYTSAELLDLHAAITLELGQRGVLRSANNPTGDLAEYLFCEAFGWKQAQNSESGFDATGPDGIRYQIKSRRLHQKNTSRQVSALRQLETEPFDILAGVLFAPDYTIQRAALIPISVVREHARYRKHTNAHVFHLRDAVWDLAEVEDVTDALRAVVL